MLSVWCWPDFYVFWLIPNIWNIDGSFFVPVLNIPGLNYSHKEKKSRPLYCYVCMECFQGSLCFRVNCVPCRKRVQRYIFFSNYKTFTEKIFGDFFTQKDKYLILKQLHCFKSFQQATHFINSICWNSNNPYSATKSSSNNI